MSISTHPAVTAEDLAALLDRVGNGDAAAFATFYDLSLIHI